MRDLIFTGYPSARSKFGDPITQSWAAWLEKMLRHDVRGSSDDSSSKRKLNAAKDGPALVLGDIPAGASRKSPNVQSVHALALDIEGQTNKRIEAAFAALARYEHVVWTTHKHQAVAVGGEVRMRVVLPLAEPMPPADHGLAWLALNRLVGGVNDPATKDLARLHYLPSTYDPAVARAWRHEGEWLRPEDLPTAPEPTRDSNAALGAERAADAMRRRLRAALRSDAIKPVAERLVDGLPLAEPGGRHAANLKLTWWVAERDNGMSDEALRLLFGASIAAMEALDADAPGMDDIVTSYAGAVVRIRELDVDKRRARETEAAEHQSRGQGKYDENDLRRIAEINGWEPEDLADRWLIQREGIWWLLGPEGDYHGPYVEKDAFIKATRLFAKAPVHMIELTKNGHKYRSLADVVAGSGQVARKIVSDLTAKRTYYDAQTETMHEAVLPDRDLVPCFDERIDAWLALLAGPLHGKLVDWMSCVPDLTKLLCALYLDGPADAGKTLLATGLGHIWTDGPPADIELVMGDFNDELMRCPLILADEEIPKRYRSTATTALRSMISTVQRTLKRKYRPPTELRGAVRLVLAANNEFLLDSRDVSSAHDLEAVAKRFLYLSVPPAAAEFMNALPRTTRAVWGKTGIARHALWLAKHHTIEKPGKRFWVEGDASRMHRLLLTSSKWNALVTEWLVRYCMAPKAFDQLGSGLIRRSDGGLLVNDQAIIDGWELYVPGADRIQPETSKIATALRTISKTGKRRQLRYRGRQIRYRPIDVDTLMAWSDERGIGDRETILATVAGDGPRTGDTTTDDLGSIPGVNPQARPA